MGYNVHDVFKKLYLIRQLKKIKIDHDLKLLLFKKTQHNLQKNCTFSNFHLYEKIIFGQKKCNVC
jgi:hypothetical protein